MKQVEQPRTSVSSSKISAILNKNKYRSVVEQFLYDKKRKKAEFTETSRQKMNMGTMMEPVIKNLVEGFFDVNLTVDKNRYHHDDYSYMTIEFDALDYDNKVVYEFKNTEMDESHIYETYYPQVQFAMFVIGWDKARICYLRNGWDLGYVDVDKDDNFIEHMVEAAILYNAHLESDTEPNPEDFDRIAEKINFYKEQEPKKAKEVVDLYMEEIEELHRWAKIRKEINLLEIEEAKIKGKFADKFGKYEDEWVNYQNGEYIRKGNIDINALKRDHPEIDFSQYEKPDTKYQRQTLRFKKRDEDDVKINREEDII